MLGRLTPAKLQELSRHTSVDDELAEIIEENQNINRQFAHSCDDDDEEEGEFAMDEFQEKLRQIRTRSISSADGSFYLQEQNKENVEVVDTTNAAVQTSGKTLEEAEKSVAPQKSVSTKERLKSFLPAFLQKNKEQEY
jgi:hypothetical protein